MTMSLPACDRGGDGPSLANQALYAFTNVGPVAFMRVGDCQRVRRMPEGVSASATRAECSMGQGAKGPESRCKARARRRMCPALCRVLWYFGGGLPREAMKRRGRGRDIGDRGGTDFDTDSVVR